MNWFGRKKKAEKEQMKQLKDDMTSISENLEVITESIAKLTRIQYKSTKSIEEKLDKVEMTIVSQEEQDNVVAQNHQYEVEQGIISRQLMTHLDELDHVISGISDDELQWRDLLLSWSRDIKSNLETLGVYEINLLGTAFNPRTAESVKAVEKTELVKKPKVPYEIIDVYKRGFVAKNGQAIRKAIVATIKED